MDKQDRNDCVYNLSCSEFPTLMVGGHHYKWTKCSEIRGQQDVGQSCKEPSESRLRLKKKKEQFVCN